LGHSRELINEVAITDEVSDRNVLDPEHLCNVLVFIDINIEVLELAVVLLYCIDKHWL